MQRHVRVRRPVGAVLLAVDVSVNDDVMSDPSVPLGRSRRRPRKPGGRCGQSHHAQVKRESARNLLLRADVLDKLFSGARPVLGAQVEAVGGALEETCHSVVVVRTPEVMHREQVLVGALVAQTIADQLTRHVLRRLPLDEGGVAHCDADQHGRPARNWERGEGGEEEEETRLRRRYFGDLDSL